MININNTVETRGFIPTYNIKRVYIRIGNMRNINQLIEESKYLGICDQFSI